MNFKSKIPKYKTSTQEVIVALKSEFQWLDLLGIKDSSLTRLIDVIRRLGSRPEEMDSENWSIKSIAKEVDETPAKVTKWVRQLYDDLWKLNEVNPDVFPGIGFMCTLYFCDTDMENYNSFNLRTQATFSLGDSFDWYFLKGRYQTQRFFVESINHMVVNGRLETTIHLKPGIYNLYRQTLVDKASFLNLISWTELYDLFDFQIDELLRYRVEDGRSGYPEHMASVREYYEKNKKRHW